MKPKFLFLTILIGISLFFLANSYFGWYGYQKWKNRIGTISINESKKRGVFEKELNYEIIDSQNLHNFKFKPYFEKGFKVGMYTSEETNPVKYSKYPFNLSFDRNKNDSIYLNILNKDRSDSSDVVWTYFKNPKLKDTIIIKIDAPKNKKGKHISGTIKVW